MEIVIQYESQMVPVPGPDGPVMHEGAKYLVTIVGPTGKSEALCAPVAMNFLEFVARLKRIGRLIENDASVKPVDLILGSPAKNSKNQSGKFILSTRDQESQSNHVTAGQILLNKLASETGEPMEKIVKNILMEAE